MSLENVNEDLCARIRTLLVERGAKRASFHVASSLGVVELAVAIYSVLDPSEHQFVFDIGHFRYPFEMMRRYRETGRMESPTPDAGYDFFQHPGFAGLSISAALGNTIADGRRGAIVVIGDGALAAGEVYEALNHVGNLQTPMLIILNENGMSIQSTVGRMRNEQSVENFCRVMGLLYKGPIDGHHLPQLEQALLSVKEVMRVRPVFMHVRTVKGKGFRPAEVDPLAFHQPFFPYDPTTGEFRIREAHLCAESFLKTLGALDSWLADRMDASARLWAVTPSTPPLFQVAKRHPDRWLDGGICEQHCMTLATSLGITGRAVVGMFAPFIGRCMSQIYDLARAQANVVVVLFGSGSNIFGATQQGLQTHGMVHAVPGLRLLQTFNLADFTEALDEALGVAGPVFVLAPNMEVAGFEEYALKSERVGKKSGQAALTIVPIGSVLDLALEAKLSVNGSELVLVRHLKPMNLGTLIESVAVTKRLLIIEDGYARGGLGHSIVAELHAYGLQFSSRVVAAADRYNSSDDPERLRQDYGLSSQAISDSLSNLMRKE